MNVRDLIVELCAVPAPSGVESEISDLLRRRWTPRCAEVRVDAIGNVLAHVGGHGPRTLVQAHMDQIGYVVRHVTDDGFLLLDGAQGDRRRGVERRHQVGQPVRVLARDDSWVEGVIAAVSGHVLTAEQLEEHELRYDDFWVELGLPDRRAVTDTGVHVGSPVVFSAGARMVGELLVGPSMDDRVGLAVMDALLDAIDADDLACDLWLGATVQEENGVHGASALASMMRFDAAIALEIGLVGDVPAVRESEYSTRLGAGPIIVHRDFGIVYDRHLLQHLRAVATDVNLAVQDGVFGGFASDGRALLDSGTPTALVAVPTRYTHTAFETIHPADLETTIALMRAVVTTPLPARA